MFQRASSHPSQPFRVVIETDDPSLAIADFASFGAAGFDVVCCSGPDEHEACPAVEGRPCTRVEAADVVLNQLTDPRTRMDVVEGVRRTSPDVPMVVGGCADPGDELPDGCVPLSKSVSVNGQVNAVRRAATHAKLGTH